MGQVSFGPFAFDTDAGVLRRDGESIPLGGRAAALLTALVNADGGVVGRADLMEAGWPGLIVEEGNLTVQVAALRKALGTRPGSDWIATIPRVGYRLARREPVDEAPATGRLPVMAVLPFEDLSGDPAQSHFADAVVDDLITGLSNFRQFSVISRNSAFQYKGRAVDIRSVATELGARYVLEGSVRRSGKRLRISARLGDGHSGEQLWGHTFDGQVEDVFDVQDTISERVVGQIVPEIRRIEIERARRKRPESLDAYDFAMRALRSIYLANVDLNAEGYALATRAIELEPDYGFALNVAAWLLQIRVILGWPSLTVDDRATCLALSQRAEANAGGNPDILVARGNTLIQVAREYERGMHFVRRAVEAGPNNAFVLTEAGVCNLHAGDLDGAIELSRRAIEISPGDPGLTVPLCTIAYVELLRGNYEEAIAFADRSMTYSPSFDCNSWVMIAANAHMGRLDEARDWCRRFMARRPGMTIAAISASQKPKDPGRVTPIFEGLRLAGLPEG